MSGIIITAIVLSGVVRRPGWATGTTSARSP